MTPTAKLVTCGRTRVFALLLVALCPGLAGAQVSSAQRGTLTILFGQGSGPAGAIAAEVAQQQQLPTITKHSLGWQVTGGYNFADYFGLETGIARIGTLKSNAPYRSVDQVNAESLLTIISVDLIGRVPVASRLRFNLRAGLAESSLTTNLSTSQGSSLPFGQANPVKTRRFGYDAGIDAEWRMNDHLSLLVGYRAFPNVGSDHAVGSANGTFSMIVGGLHVEF
jgi:Outer membrane protein beta-barrel domain